MTTSILVVGTGAASVAPSRFPRALARAGAAVSLLVPADALARHTRHVVRVGLVPVGAPPTLWIEALFALVDAADPRAIVPGDAGALAFLAGLVQAPPPTLRPKRVDDLARRLDDALGAADRWPGQVVPDRGVAPAAVAGASVLPGRPVAGTGYTHHVAAHRGRVLASATAEHVVVDEGADGGPTVLRFCVREDIARTAERAIAALGASGCCALEFVVDAAGDAWLVDVVRHVGPTAHVSHWLGVDLAAAWLAALDDRETGTATSLPAGTSRYSVAFPQEWWRDSGSRWLREQRVDVPWDDPHLLEAILTDAVAATHDG